MIPKPRGLALGAAMAAVTAIVLAGAVLLSTLATHRSIRRVGQRHDALTWIARSAARNGLPPGRRIEVPEAGSVFLEIRGSWVAATASNATDRVQVTLRRDPRGRILEWDESHGP